MSTDGSVREALRQRPSAVQGRPLSFAAPSPDVHRDPRRLSVIDGRGVPDDMAEVIADGAAPAVIDVRVVTARRRRRHLRSSLVAIVLVRHALAVPRTAWDHDDARRPLTTRGERQADGLVGLLRDEACGTLLASPATRCRATLRPLARVRQVKVRTSRALEDGHGDEALDLVLDNLGDAVLCTHGEVVGEVLEGLRRSGWPIPERPRKAKGSVWLLTRDGCTYVPPAA